MFRVLAVLVLIMFLGALAITVTSTTAEVTVRWKQPAAAVHGEPAALVE